MMSPTILVLNIALLSPIWIADTPQLTLKGHSKPVVDVAVSQDGKYAASMAADGETIIWNLADKKGKFVASEAREMGEGSYLHFTRENDAILLAGTFGFSHGIDPATGRSLGTFGWKYYMNSGDLVPLGGRSVLSLNKASELQATMMDDPQSKHKLKLHATDSFIKWLPSPDRKLVITNNVEGVSHAHRNAATVYSLPDFTEVTTLKNFSDLLMDFCWLPDGSVACLERSGRITVWSVTPKAKLVGKLTNDESAYSTALTVSPDGRKLAYYRKSETAILSLNKNSAKLIKSVPAGPPYAFSNDGAKLIAASPSGPNLQAMVLDAVTGATIATIDRLNGVTWPRLSADGNSYVVGRRNGTVTFHSLGGGSGKMFAQIADQMWIPTGYVYDGREMKQTGMFAAFEGTIEFSPDKNLLVARDNNVDLGRCSFLRIGEESQHRGVWKKRGTNDKIPDKVIAHSYALRKDGSVFVQTGLASASKGVRGSKNSTPVVGGDNGIVNLATGEYRASKKADVYYSGLKATPDGARIASIVHRANGTRRLEILDAVTLKTLKVVMDDPPTTPDTVAPVFAFSSDGKRLAAWINQKNFVFDLTAEQQLPLLDDANHRQFHLIDQGKILVYVSYDKVVGYDLDDNSKAFSWEAARNQAGRVDFIDFSLDGRFAVCGSSLGEISIREARTGKVIGQQKVFDSPVQGVGISADGGRIAAADRPRRVIVWDVNVAGGANAGGGETVTAEK